MQLHCKWRYFDWVIFSKETLPIHARMHTSVLLTAPTAVQASSGCKYRMNATPLLFRVLRSFTTVTLKKSPVINQQQKEENLVYRLIFLLRTVQHLFLSYFHHNNVILNFLKLNGTPSVVLCIGSFRHSVVLCIDSYSYDPHIRPMETV